MSTAAMLKRVTDTSPRLKARIAGALYLLSFLTAAFSELFARGRLNFALGLIAVLGMVVVTLLLYDIFKPVNRGLSLLAAFFALVGLAFEALRLQPGGVNLAIVFAGFYCLLIGYLIFRATFLPRVLGALAEMSVFLWLLLMGVNAQRWNGLGSARRVSRQ
jgi:hypothetical protein